MGLAQNGLIFSADPPPFLKSTRTTPYGNASYAQSPSSDGQIWAVGYDGGACIVFTIKTPLGPIEQRMKAMFAVPGTWEPEPAGVADAGERKPQYGWQTNGKNLQALVSLRDLAGDLHGMTMVTVVEVKKDPK